MRTACLSWERRRDSPSRAVREIFSATWCSQAARDSCLWIEAAFLARTRKVAWKASSASQTLPSIARQIPSTRGPWRSRSVAKAVSSRRTTNCPSSSASLSLASPPAFVRAPMNRRTVGKTGLSMSASKSFGLSTDKDDSRPASDTLFRGLDKLRFARFGSRAPITSPELSGVGEGSPAARAFAVVPVDQRRERGRLGQGHDRPEGQRCAVRVVAVGDAAYRVAEDL